MVALRYGPGRHRPTHSSACYAGWTTCVIPPKDRTFKTVRPNLGTASRDCSDPQTAVVVNHQDRPG